jgi:hypothetical protein
MRIDFGARLASYVALAFSCICLIHAEATFMPGIGWSLPVVLGLLLAAYRLEGRWALPVWVANLLAFASCGGMFVALWQYVENNPQSFAANVPFPVAWVPFAGPPFLVLLLIKLFRKRRPADVWQLQAMGLLQAGLACVLGADPLLGLLLCCYLISGLWWLALHYLQQRQERSAAPTSAARVPWRWAGVPRAARWVFIALACSLIFAILTPRISPSPWNPLELLGATQPHSRAEIGVPSSIDLNREGTVEFNDEIVMEVEAKDAAGNPMLDLSANQRFRGAYLDLYREGHWDLLPPAIASVLDLPREVPRIDPDLEDPPGVRGIRSVSPKGGAFGGVGNAGPNPMNSGSRQKRFPGARLPNLGPTQYFLKFKLRPRKAGGLFLADPVLLMPEHSVLPVMPLDPYNTPAPLFSESQGGLLHVPPPSREIEYRQVTRRLDDPDIGPPVAISASYVSTVTAEPPRSLRLWTNEVTRRLVATSGSGLEEKDFNSSPRGGPLTTPPRNREKVARALCNFLRNSGEYTYTLDLRRQDHNIDPTEDFLRNAKEGHCQRYAGGLTLMLRSLGIPARIVKGFRGCETSGNGVYQVRNSNAHAWVEALVERIDAKGLIEQHWLALDPTPYTSAPPAPPFSFAKWWENCRIFSAEFWRFFIAEYGTEEQSALAHELWSKVAPGSSAGNDSSGMPRWLLILPPALVVALVPYAVRRRRHLVPRAADAPPTLAFYACLLDLLASHAGLRPAVGQTPREFGDRARRWLGGWEMTACLADLPVEVAALFYRVRYGDRPLAEDEQSAINQQLDELALLLARTHRVAAATARG